MVVSANQLGKCLLIALLRGAYQAYSFARSVTLRHGGIIDNLRSRSPPLRWTYELRFRHRRNELILLG